MRRLLIKSACLVAVLIAPSLAAAAGTSPPGPCRLIDPSTCPNANELVKSSGFAQALGHFANSAKANYFRSNRSLSEQALTVLGGTPEHVVLLDDKRFLFAAVPSHDRGGDAAVVILNEFGQIQALGFSSFHCDVACEDHRYLDFYVRKDTQDEAVLAALKTWGTSDRIRKALWRSDADDGLDGRTAVHVLP
ncbi:hypothetical protein ISN76_04055 [Dyella halodurans]|uniref:Secreted protein n=1 Tax=Dyella halodurans TaxID=1920171 RepID=A0ABV9BY42_9GAMM|nr:hypothetical protein [Dyella halodurans]